TVTVGKREDDGEEREEVGVGTIAFLTNLTPKQSKRTRLEDWFKVKLEMRLLEHFTSIRFDVLLRSKL
ncbi:13256_t:CDS:1, partial [Racocetra fulgida]